jgi:hypothetical protein
MVVWAHHEQHLESDRHQRELKALELPVLAKSIKEVRVAFPSLLQYRLLYGMPYHTYGITKFIM